MDFDQIDWAKYLPSPEQEAEDEDYKRRVRIGGDLMQLFNTPSGAEIYSKANIQKPDYRQQSEDVIKSMPDRLGQAGKIASVLSAYQGAQKAKVEGEKIKADSLLGSEALPDPEVDIYKKAGYPVKPGMTRAQAKALGWDMEKALGMINSKGVQGDKSTAAGTELVSGLRKERSGLPTTKATQDVVGAYSKILKTANNPTAAGDMSLIYNYMKMLDPGSTVREGEFANAAQAGSIPSKIVAAYNKSLEGTRLDDKMRADFLGQARNLYDSQKKNQQIVDDQYRALAKKAGQDPNDAIVNFWEDIPDGGGVIAPSNEDAQAISWAKANPNDPRSAKILKLHGM